MSGFRDYEQYDALALADLLHRRLVTADELLDAAIECRPRRDAVEFAKRAAQENSNGDQTMRFPAFQQRAGRVFHRHSTH
jgi:hypothetical protein